MYLALCRYHDSAAGEKYRKMVVNFGHVVFAQVRQLVANLNKKNFKASSGELCQASEEPLFLYL